MRSRVVASWLLGAMLLAGCGSSVQSTGAAPPTNPAGGPVQPGIQAKDPGDAGDLVYLPVEELARLSSHVARGQVVSTSAAWNEARTAIVTTVEFDVYETMRGEALPARIRFTQLGGEVDGVEMNYGGRPVFHAGEHLVLFLEQRGPEHYIVVGLQQGRMDVVQHPESGEDVAVRSMVGITQARGLDGTMRALDDQQDPAWLPLDTLRERVR